MNGEYAGYVKDLKSGGILGISNKRCLSEIAFNNQELVKRNQKHAIEFEVLNDEDGQRLYNECGHKNLSAK